MKYVHFLAYQLYLNNTVKISYFQILQFRKKTECKIPYNNQVKKQKNNRKPPKQLSNSLSRYGESTVSRVESPELKF